ncbi:Zinc finger CCHC domain-containing protein [Echinococcus granulosus]|uniref:Zinc finger CCHC domain-containing protein n=1 Tax=Echinococcus granulosus TaxID=6210 RepID=W6V1J5_ECHGR|nr:Zinc finger CCHC domain-containing protein [Echinococcus granulosus]EUB64812.1 Zinc finger CCHC domain-containing protein [Echinococcus granulosus]
MVRLCAGWFISSCDLPLFENRGIMHLFSISRHQLDSKRIIVRLYTSAIEMSNLRLPAFYYKKTSNETKKFCQKCLQDGHWTYECKGKHKYLERESRTAHLSRRMAKISKKELERTASDSSPHSSSTSSSSSDSEDSSDSSSSSSYTSPSSDESEKSSSSSASSSGLLHLSNGIEERRVICPDALFSPSKGRGLLYGLRQGKKA